MSNNTVNYNNLFHLIDQRKTFSEIGDPQNVLKTLIVVNVLMVVIAVGLCFIPIPFMAPVVIIIYLVSFTVLNIKYLRDFTLAIYQYDNQQIQSGISTYLIDESKISDLSEQVNQQLEEDYQSTTNIQNTLQSIFNGIIGRTPADEISALLESSGSGSE